MTVEKQEEVLGKREGHVRDSTWGPEGDRQSHGEDKEQDSTALPKPSSPGAAEMNNLDMQGETVRRRNKKLETLEENHRTWSKIKVRKIRFKQSLKVLNVERMLVLDFV